MKTQYSVNLEASVWLPGWLACWTADTSPAYQFGFGIHGILCFHWLFWLFWLWKSQNTVFSLAFLAFLACKFTKQCVFICFFGFFGFLRISDANSPKRQTWPQPNSILFPNPKKAKKAQKANENTGFCEIVSQKSQKKLMKTQYSVNLEAPVWLLGWLACWLADTYPAYQFGFGIHGILCFH